MSGSLVTQKTSAAIGYAHYRTPSWPLDRCGPTVLRHSLVTAKALVDIGVDLFQDLPVNNPPFKHHF